MQQILPLLTAFGLGSIVTSLVQAWFSRKALHDERSFKEKQAVYIGLLEAYHRAAAEGTAEAAMAFAYWQMRCELVAPKPVRNAISSIIATNDDRVGRNVAHELLKETIREDLGVTN